jgi:dihydroorotase
MNPLIIRSAKIVNEGRIFESDILIRHGHIDQVSPSINVSYKADEYRAEGKYLLPGVIDDQVHFREPGLTHKADIHSESRAAVAGGVTSYMEMPNTHPPAITNAKLEEKYAIAARNSMANYSFYLGGTNDNLDELLRIDKHNVCGIKLFIGSSTGNMLVDNEETLNHVFSQSDALIAIHSESEPIIRQNLAEYKARYGENIPFDAHPEIRSAEACYNSTRRMVNMARKYNTRLHVLHITTAAELEFFTNAIPLSQKHITSEVCVHHLWFDSSDYERLGGLIKCNPAIKEESNRKALFEALLDDRIDVIATDHAPHTWEEKQQTYLQCPSGLPLVQHPLQIMLEFYKQGKISLEWIAKKMSHDVAVCFKIEDRGYIREGYKADLAIVDLDAPQSVSKENIFYKGGWSPFEGYEFQSSIAATFVNGIRVWDGKSFKEDERGERLKFHV